jgi:hypothetical protein
MEKKWNKILSSMELGNEAPEEKGNNSKLEFMSIINNLGGLRDRYDGLSLDDKVNKILFCLETQMIYGKK